MDVYIPVGKEKFDQVVGRVMEIFGNPKSNYPLQRARFVTSVQDKHVDVFVINEEDSSWKDSEIFYEFLLTHPDKLQDYRQLKERFMGKSIKAYYTAKIEFINEVVSGARSLQ